MPAEKVECPERNSAFVWLFFGHGACVLVLTQAGKFGMFEMIGLCFTLHLFVGWAATEKPLSGR